MSRLKNKKGFTLIELVIVLAIAALIIAAILFAVGGAQESRRNTQRKNDLGTIASYLEQYASNNQGAYPTTAAILNGAFTTQYLANVNDPQTGGHYTFTVTAAAPAAVAHISYELGYMCSGSTMAIDGAGTNTREYAMVTYLEGGSTDCQSNH
jgi:prepilin-type N-terminal cleavage/methylation domain-containing protein